MKQRLIFFTLLLFTCTLALNAQQVDAEGCATAKKVAQDFYNQGNYEEAKKRFEFALQYCGDDAEVKSLISKCDSEIKKNGQAKHKAITQHQQKTVINNDINDLFHMVYVEGATLTIGCTAEQGQECYDWEKPAHQVTLSGFYIGKTEVTQGQWDAIMGKNKSHGDWETQYGLGDNYPAYRVSWNDIQQFIAKLNNMQTQYTYRLPSEAEWEFAARGGIKNRGYKYSGSNNASEVAWYNDNSGGKTHPVGQKKGNELGLYDMSGNVWELCQDWYGSYSSNVQTNPKGPSSGSDRVRRGGSWNYGIRYVRVSARYNFRPVIRSNLIGFRLACSPR